MLMMERQVILLTETLVRNRSSMCCRLQWKADRYSVAKMSSCFLAPQLMKNVNEVRVPCIN